ncbi:MAG: 50S ribosomal protein L4 [Calditrichaeota bacterium]|nr:MAG: 50S ribosomal protein L4 [Calditrichota bacterium]
MEAKVYQNDGTLSSETAQLADSVFGIEPNEHVVYLAVKAYLANKRQGTHSTKERAEVRGGGRKPWKQKGRGAARAGTRRSPLWVGGGTVFGPRPHTYKISLPKKVKKLARRSVLSLKAKSQNVFVIDDLSFDTPKTSQLVNILKKMEVDTSKVMILTSECKRAIYNSGRNIPYFSVEQAKVASSYDILNCRTLIIEKTALKDLEEILG